MNLLITGCLSVLPNVAICLETVKNVFDLVFKSDDRRKGLKQKNSAYNSARRNEDSQYMSRAHKYDQQERYKDYQRGTVVAHQCKKRYANCGKACELNEIPSGLESVKRSCADKNVQHLYDFRRLKRKRSDNDPVSSSVFCSEKLAVQYTDHQQSCR